MRCEQDLVFLSGVVNDYLKLLGAATGEAVKERAQVSLNRIAVDLNRELAPEAAPAPPAAPAETSVTEATPAGDKPAGDAAE